MMMGQRGWILGCFEGRGRPIVLGSLYISRQKHLTSLTWMLDAEMEELVQGGEDRGLTLAYVEPEDSLGLLDMPCSFCSSCSLPGLAAPFSSSNS